jgi:hypothetical protein
LSPPSIHLPRTLFPYISFYNEPPATDLVKLIYQVDWKSSQNLIEFKDGYFDLRTNLENNYHLIISVKEIVFTKEKAGQVTDVGFTIMPLIDDKGFAFTGSYQLPLFKKDLTKGITDELQKEDPFARLLQMMGEKDPKTKKPIVELLQFSSVMIRIKDNYYDKLYEKPLDPFRLQQYFLPENKKEKYIYDQKIMKNLEKTKRMNALLPKGAVDFEFNELMRRTMGLAYNVQFEEVDEGEPSKPVDKPPEEED